MLLGGALTGSYAAYWSTKHVLITIPSYVSSFSLIDATKLGIYAGGVVTAMVLLSLNKLVSRVVFARPDPLFKELYKRLHKDPVVLDRLGGRARASSFKAYNFKGGLVWTGNGPAYSKPTLQIVFQVTNPDNESAVGVVSADVDRWKAGRAHTFNALAVDFPGTGERILLEGSEDAVPFKGIIRLH